MAAATDLEGRSANSSNFAHSAGLSLPMAYTHHRSSAISRNCAVCSSVIQRLLEDRPVNQHTSWTVKGAWTARPWRK